MITNNTFVRRLASTACLWLALSTVAAAQDVSPMLVKLHDALHLTSDQDSAWRDYVKAVSQDSQSQSRHMATAQLLPQLPTPRRLALLDATMTRDLADFHQRSQAIVAFYGHLSPDQQHTFDQQTLPPSDPKQGGSGHALKTPPSP